MDYNYILLVLRMDHEDPLYKCDNPDTYICIHNLYTFSYHLF